MAGLIAAIAEVAGGSDNAPAQVVLPEAVDDDTRQQLAAAAMCIGDPLGQCPAAITGAPTRGGCLLPAAGTLGLGHQYLEKTLAGDAFLVVRVAAPQEVRFRQEIIPLRMQTNGRQ